jgi:hypothetical protein
MPSLFRRMKERLRELRVDLRFDTKARQLAAGQPAAAVPHGLSINREGRRFIDESLGYVMHGKAVLNRGA